MDVHDRLARRLARAAASTPVVTDRRRALDRARALAPTRRCSRSSARSSCVHCRCASPSSSSGWSTKRGRTRSGKRCARGRPSSPPARSRGRTSASTSRPVPKPRCSTACFASGGIFDVLGVTAVRGRTFTAGDDDRSRLAAEGPVAVISHALWQRRYNGADDVIGRSIAIERAAVHDHRRHAARVLRPRGRDARPTCSCRWRPRPTCTAGGERPRRAAGLVAEHHVPAARRATIDAAAAALHAVQPQIRAETLPPQWRPAEMGAYLETPIAIEPAVAGRSELRQRYQHPLTVVMAVVGVDAADCLRQHRQSAARARAVAPERAQRPPGARRVAAAAVAAAVRRERDARVAGHAARRGDRVLGQPRAGRAIDDGVGARLAGSRRSTGACSRFTRRWPAPPRSCSGFRPRLGSRVSRPTMPCASSRGARSASGGLRCAACS